MKEREMKITTIGRGNVGGGLADLWEHAGHQVTRIGNEGGDVSEVDAVLVAVPGGAIEAALDNVRGLEGKTAVEQLTRDAGYEPLHGGPLANAHAQEEFLVIYVGLANEIGPFVYRMAPPAEL